MATTLTRVQTSPAYFESIYREADGNASQIPWDDGGPSPSLVNWLNATASSVIRCGARVAIVGCGLGHDAREMISRGYDVTAFDCSETAIEWARRIDPAHVDCYVQADMTDLPMRWRHRFDLVVEINTLHALSPELRQGAWRAIAELLSPHGRLLVVCRGLDGDSAGDEAGDELGPPWALTAPDLAENAALAGLTPEGVVSSFMDDEDPPVRRVRAVFVRA